MAYQPRIHTSVSQVLVEAMHFVGDLQTLQDQNKLMLGQDDLNTIQDYLADIATFLGIEIPSEEE